MKLMKLFHLLFSALPCAIAFQSSTRGLPAVAPPSSHLFRNPGHKVPHASKNTALGSAVAPVVAALDTFWKSDPYAAAALVCGFKASCADLVAQKRDVLKRQEKLARSSAAATTEGDAATASLAVESAANPKARDWKRNLAFILYGSIYQGVAQEYIYNHLYPVMFGSAVTPVIVAKKVLFDIFLQTTLVTLPIAYITKSIVFRYSVREALRRYIHDIRFHGLLKKYFFLWGPVQCLTFSVVPEHLRVTWIAMVSFFWLIILSSISSKTKKAPAPVDGELSLDELEAEILDCSLEDGLTCNIDG